MKSVQTSNQTFSKVFHWTLPLLMLVAGLYFFPLKIFEHFSKIPGDMGDARFNNYVLEHGYKYFSGKISEYWNAPFMYPYKNVIALSDNLLGTLPIYSLFRIIHLDRETSFQFWLLSLFTLNFLCCFAALKKWSGNLILSVTGAYIFAFSIFNIDHLGHAQVLPRFIAPLVFYWCWKFLSQKQLKYFIYAVLGTVYQFYCGIYLGFLLFYAILFLFIGYFIIYKDWKFFHQFKNLKTLRNYIFVIIAGGILLAPIMIPYLHVAQTLGTRSFSNVINSIPRLRSYFFTTQAPVLWRFLYGYSAFTFPEFWNHFLFPGALPWLGIIVIPFIFISKKIKPENKRFIAFVSISFLLAFIFCLNINGFTLYKIIYYLPGFSSMRSVDRMITILIIYFILAFVFVFRELYHTSKIMKWVVFCFPILVIGDNFIETWDIKGYDKAESQLKIQKIKKDIQKQYDAHYNAFAYIPVSAPEDEDLNKAYVSMHLSVMLAAQELNIPCVNGYTGFTPANFFDFFINPDGQLNNWCDSTHIDAGSIQRINDIGKKIKSRDPIHLLANNGKFLCADESRGDSLIANKDKASTWETFLLIRFDDGSCALRTHTNHFFKYNEQGNIAANGETVDESELFKLVELNDQFITFQTANGKYISFIKHNDEEYLFAKSNSLGEAGRFKIERK
jgi:hypothetical protein